MALPLNPPLSPQLARSRKALPEGDGWSYERKWDGFRAIAFVDGADTRLLSRSGKPLERYFPELVLPAGRYVMDGEIVIVGGDAREDFAALQQRIHPAQSRIAMLSAATPARYVAFDLLAREDEVLLEHPFAERRDALEAQWREPVVLADTTRDPEAARRWLADTEGVIAKREDGVYRPGSRNEMVKVKRLRTVDCILVGWRPGKEPETVGSLILGLYARDGELVTVGHTSGLKAAEKRELIDTLAPYASGEHGSAEPSRWSSDRDLEWVALRPELVVEVSFDQVSAGRIRHGARLERWRKDKPPQECTLDQLDQ